MAGATRSYLETQEICLLNENFQWNRQSIFRPELSSPRSGGTAMVFNGLEEVLEYSLSDTFIYRLAWAESIKKGLSSRNLSSLVVKKLSKDGKIERSQPLLFLSRLLEEFYGQFVVDLLEANYRDRVNIFLLTAKEVGSSNFLERRLTEASNG